PRKQGPRATDCGQVSPDFRLRGNEREPCEMPDEGQACAKRSRARALAFSASTARSRAGACVCSEASSVRAACETSSTALSKAAAFACDGLLNPESLRTN